MTGSWALNLFDRFHLGHQVLIERLLELPEPRTACVVEGEFVGHNLELPQLIQPIDLRVKNLKRYLAETDGGDTIDVVTMSQFDDLLRIEGSTTFLVFQGPCCAEIDELGLARRQQVLGTEDERVYLKPVMARDGGKLSSARIRLGEIDREGRRLKGTDEPPRRLPETGRGSLKTPKGILFDVCDGPPEARVGQRLEEEKPPVVIAVGDVTSTTLLDVGVQPDVCIVDGATKRGAFEREVRTRERFVIYNPPATIYPEAWSTIATAIECDAPAVIAVEGEEDLLGFPAVLLAPEDAVMLYGQPDRGIVWVPVNTDSKAAARALLEQMPVIE